MKMTTRRGRTSRAEQLVVESTWSTPVPVATEETATALAGAPLFRQMTREEIARALTDFDEARYPGGRRVVLEGLRGSDFFLVLAGSASVLVDGRRFATLGPGDFFGELAILGDGLRTASVRADTPLRCLVLPNGRLEQLILDHPQVGINLLHTVVGRFIDMSGRRRPRVGEATVA